MTFGCYNKMNMLGMGNMFGLGNMFGGTNVISQLFSGTNSIFGGGFNMYGNYGTGSCGLFMDCKGNYNYDAMAGFAVGGALLNVAGAAIGQAIENKKENSVENLEADVKDAQGKLDASLKELGVSTVEDASSLKIDDKFEITVNEKLAEVNRLDAEIKKLKEPTAPAASASEEEKEKYNKAIVTYNKQKAELNALLTSAKAAQKEAEDAKDKEQLRIDGLKAAVEEANRKLQAAQEALQEKQLDKADGSILNRTSEKQFKKLFKTDSSGNETLNSEAKISKADVRFAVLGYKNAKTDEERKAWAKKFQILYYKLDTTDANNKNISAAYEIIKKDFPNK